MTEKHICAEVWERYALALEELGTAKRELDNITKNCPRCQFIKKQVGL